MIAKLKTMASGFGKGVKLPSSATLVKLLPIFVLAMGLTALAMMFMWRSDASYKPLFGAREDVSASETMSVLESENIPFRLHPQSGQVLVPESKLSRARMLLAAKGVVARLPEGLEQVDKSDPLGVSQFVQDVRFRRGLEGELIKSIMSLDPVESARVHLSIAKSSSFIFSDGDKSSASVVLTLKPGRKLSKEQIGAIIGMVSGSVANLDPAKVAVIDQHGNYLSSTIDPNDLSVMDGEVGARVREETLRNIRDLLAQSLGEGNFKASVMVETDNDRIEEMHEQYGEDPRITNEATRDEQDNSQMALGVPGSLSNRPNPTSNNVQAADDKKEPTSKRNAITRQYVYDRNVVQIKRAPTRVKRVSVAVVLNNAASPDGKVWTSEQLGKIESILQSGIGRDEAREDQLTVSALDFHMPAVDAPLPWWKQPEHMLTMGGYTGYALLALLIFLLVLRPLIKILRQWVVNQNPQIHDNSVDVAEGDALKTDIATTAQTSSLLTEDEIPLPPVGSSADVLVEHLKVLAAQAPERVADVIKPWIRKHG
ncbi:flagellar M-ring protein FliF [Dyella sp. M7H15-1]|uniref:flagellar basal-body MS-ring/collar protein FliF n=1 Tax=Dyella sp. M7H15-1 TaxID=2501295 RepID=UPI00100500DF|nr:flagellar basal-body MS-ring/collar protein FliF [Dyella sp. M7H15-1]QAU24301.1 flagellar M-ring protein FliF [Dyella sp. M7H15-1]